MTRTELEELRSLRKELISLQQDFMRPNGTEVNIFYKDYHGGTGIPRVETGMDYGEEEQKRLAKLIARKSKALQSKILDTEHWIDSIDDAEMRGIVRMYYEQGMTLEDIGSVLGYDRSTIGKKLKNFTW